MRLACLLLPALLTLALAAPAHAVERCRVAGPSGTPIDLRDARLHVTGNVENGAVVYIDGAGQAGAGKPWVFVVSDDGDELGWAPRGALRCF